MGFAWARPRGFRWRVVAAVVSGALYVAAFPAFEHAYLAWFCLVPVLWALDGVSSGREAVAVGWVLGLVAQLGTMGWVYQALRQGAALPAAGALAGYVGLSAAQAGLYAVWAFGVQRLRMLGVSLALAAPVTFVLAEWLYPAAFPTYLANTQFRRFTLLQTVDLWGPLGLSFLIVLCSTVLYELGAWPWRRRLPARALLATAALVSASLVYGAGVALDVEDSASHAVRELRVGVVQADSDWTGGYDDRGLRHRREQSLEVVRQGVDLVIWPEASYGEIVRDTGGVVTRGLERPLLFGALRHEPSNERRRVFSSALLADAKGNIIGTHDRRHLLAFKDFLPGGDVVPALYDVLPHGIRLDPGEGPRTLELDRVRLGVVLSHEELFPGYVREVMGGGADLLVGLSDGWLEKGRGPRVQLALATLRAVEHRRYFVRATPAGVSAVISPTGRIVGETTLGARANLVADVGALSGRTVYAALGDWPGWACLLALAWWLRPHLVAAVRRYGAARSATHGAAPRHVA